MEGVLAGYFDYAASTPPYPSAVRAATNAAQEYFGNPSSAHFAGRTSRQAVENARNTITAECGLNDARLVFTSSGTEANNLVLRSATQNHPKSRLLLAADVHESAWQAAYAWGEQVDILPVQSDGRIDPTTLERYMKDDTTLCSIAHANNETGIIQNMDTVGHVCWKHGVRVHCDGAQMLGESMLNLADAPVDYYTFSAHKFGGLKGIGGVFVDKNCSLTPQIEGGPQEGRYRAGTENTPGIVAAATAITEAHHTMDVQTSGLRMLANQLVDAVLNQCPGTVVNSDAKYGLPGLVSFSFPGVSGSQLVTDLGISGFAVSAGSACHSDQTDPSRVIMAMGRSQKEALGTIRVSMGRYTEADAVDNLAQSLSAAVERQQALQGGP